MSANMESFDESDFFDDDSFIESFATHYLHHIGVTLEPIIKEIANTWVSIGLPSSMREERVLQMDSDFVSVAKKIEANIKEFHSNQLNIRENKLKEINQILKSLSFDPYKLDYEKSILVQNSMLQKKYDELLEVKSEREQQMEHLSSKIKKVVHLLGLSYHVPDFKTDIPSEEELMELASKLLKNEQVLNERRKRLDLLRNIMLKYQDDLEYYPENETERMILGPIESFIYSKSNMVSLATFHKKIEQLYSETMAQVASMKDKLMNLFKRLETDENTKNSFFESLTGTLPHQIKMLEEEITFYENLKQQYMEKFIHNIRSEIEPLIRDCRVSEFNFSILESVDYSEDLLNKHEEELSTLKTYKSIYEKIFLKLDEYESLMEKLLELEKKMNDPNRFNNRGGALLTNERERRTLNKKLPRLESEIKLMVTSSQSSENIPFNNYGLDITEVFSANWEHFKQVLDEEKSKQSSVCNKSNVGSAKKINLAARQKARVPFSPKANGSGTSRKLFTPTKITSSNLRSNEIENEVEFQKHLGKDLHSTMLGCDDGFKSQSRLIISSPTPRALNRRRSKSVGSLIGSAGVSRRNKRPFYP